MTIFSVSMGIFGFFTEMFHKTFVQIAEFDWLPGLQKGLIFVKMLKNLLLRDRKVDKADTLHTC